MFVSYKRTKDTILSFFLPWYMSVLLPVNESLFFPFLFLIFLSSFMNLRSNLNPFFSLMTKTKKGSKAHDSTPREEDEWELENSHFLFSLLFFPLLFPHFLWRHSYQTSSCCVFSRLNSFCTFILFSDEKYRFSKNETGRICHQDKQRETQEEGRRRRRSLW